MNDISKNSELDEINVEQKQINRLRDIKITNSINTFFRDKSVFYMWFKGIFTDPSARYFKYEYNAYKNKILQHQYFGTIQQYSQLNRDHLSQAVKKPPFLCLPCAATSVASQEQEPNTGNIVVQVHR